MTPRLRELLFASCVFTLAAIVMTWPLVRHMGTALPSDLGDPLLTSWVLGWDADRLAHGLRGLWNAPNFYPHRLTLTFSEHLLGIAILVAPIEWVSRNPVLANNVAFLLAFIVAGTGMYLLALSLFDRHDAAFVAGLAYAFGPDRTAQLSRIQVLSSGWLPIALWALHRYFGSYSRRWLMVFVAAFLLQCLSNSYFVYIAPVAVASVVVYDVVRRRPSLVRARLLDLALAAGIVFAVMAPIAWFYIKARRDLHLVRAIDEIRMYGADVGAYLHADPSIRLWRHLPGIAMIEGDLFPGLAVLILAAVAMWRWHGGPAARRLYACIGILGFLISLGVQPTAWHHVLLRTGPYAWLMPLVPGFDGMRVPARFSVLVELSLSLLAAAGFARVQRKLSRPWRRVWMVGVSVLVLVEGCAAPIPLAELVRPWDDRRAYAALRASAPGAVVEFPIQRPLSFSPLVYPVRDASGFLNTRYQYETLFHHHPIVNGASGYEPLLNVLLRRVIDEHRLGEAVLMLRSLGVRYAIVRPPDTSIQPLTPVPAIEVAALPDQILNTRTFGTTVLFELRPLTPPPEVNAVRRVEPTAFTLSASDSGDRLNRMIDGNLATRWITGHPQIGGEWIEARFARTIDLAVVHIEQGDSLTDYPRALRVETADSAGSPRVTLFEGTVVPELGQGLVRDPHRAPIEIVLPSNHTSIVRLRQTGRAQPWSWSIHEIEFRERR